MTRRIAILALGVAMTVGLALRTGTLSLARPQDDKMASQDKGKMKDNKMDKKMDKKDKMSEKSRKHKKDKMKKMDKMDKMEKKSKMDDKH